MTTNQPTSTDTLTNEKYFASQMEQGGDNKPQHRDINTFMKRKTHIGKKAEAGLMPDCWHFFIQTPAEFNVMGISHIIDLRQQFTNPDAALTLEIGFGMGTSLVEMAKASPECNFVGIEVHEAGLGNCAYLGKAEHLTNLKLICGDAIALLKQLPPEHIDTLQLYFPDPWQKKRHYKRRFVTPERMAIVVRVLKTQGIFHAATDWEHYAFSMIEVLNSLPNFENMAQPAITGQDFISRPDFRPLTKFEKRGIEEGRGIWDIMYRKI